MNADFQLLAQESATLLGIHITWILLLTLGASRWIRHTILKRTLWRSTFVAILLLLGSTFSGLYQWNWMSGVTLHAAAPTSQWKPMQLVSDSIATTSIQPEAPVIQIRDTKAPSSSTTTTTALLLQIWFLGMVITFSLMMINAMIWRIRIFRNASPASSHLRYLFKQAATSLNYRGTPQLIESPIIRSPLVMGCVRPVIAFPVDYANLYNADEQHLIMSHEIAHLSEKDGWWQCLANLVCMAAWWHPLVWIARQLLRQCAEETADNLSTHNTTHREQLATCLVRIGRELNATRCPGALSIFGAGFRSQLGKRVERLIQHDPSWNERPKGVLWISLRLAAPLLLFGALFSTASWFGTYSGSSASDSMRHSVVGLMLMAEEEGPPFEFPDSNITHTNNLATSQKDTITDDHPHHLESISTINSNTVTRLKSIIVPEFHMTTATSFSGTNILENLRNLRKTIINSDPSWKNITFILRGKITQGNPGAGVVSVNALAHLQMGEMEAPSFLPEFNPGTLIPQASDLPESSMISPGSSQVATFSIKNASAYDLLLRLLDSEDDEDHYHILDNIVVVDIDHIESSVQPNSRVSTGFEGPPSPTLSPNFSAKALPLNTAEAEAPEFYTRVYKTNPPSFLQRIMALSGSLNTSQSPGDSDIQKTVHKFISNLGIKNISETAVSSSVGPAHNDASALRTIQDAKAVFYNDRNGNLLTRLTLEDHDKLEAALALLQDPAERNTKIAMSMHVVQLNEAGIKTLKEFGFDTTTQDSGQFEHTIDTPTLERLLLRMNLAPGVDMLQSPRITALNGRQSELKAQELRRIVTHNESGNIQTEEVATGPSLSIIPQIQPNGQLEMTVHFELLEFMGYDDPGPFRIVSQNGNTETTSASTNKNRSTIDGYKEMIKEMESAPKRETPLIILKYMPNQIRLKHLSNELETAQQSKAQIESKVSRNAKDTINSHRELAAVNDLISALQKQIDQEVASIRRHILAQMDSQELSGDNENKPIESTTITASGNDSTENNPVPLPRFNRLELTTKTTLQSGQTLIMGGLKSTETIKWKNNIPVMSKLPLLGSMFRREGTSTTEQYIYVLITPQILE